MVHMSATKYIDETIGRILGTFCFFLGAILGFGVFGVFFKPGGPKDEAEEGGPAIPKIDSPHLIYLYHGYYHILQTPLFESNGKTASDNALARKRMADFDAFAKAQPVLFVYGADKGLMFHTTKQLEQFKTASFDVKTPEGSTKTLKSQVLGIEKAGDYVYKQENDVCIKAVGKLLSELRVLPRTSPGASIGL